MTERVTSWHVGEHNPKARLTYDQVLEIREKIADGARNVDLAKEYGVAAGHISDIRHGRKWNKGRGQQMDPDDARRRKNDAERARRRDQRAAYLLDLEEGLVGS